MKKYILLILISINILFSQINTELGNSVKSLVYPGWGESAIGEKKRAKTFFITEASIWVIYFANKKSSDWYQKDYLSFVFILLNPAYYISICIVNLLNNIVQYYQEVSKPGQAFTTVSMSD